MMRKCLASFIVCFITVPVFAGAPEEIARLSQPSPNPMVNRQAWQQLVAVGPTALLPILRAFPSDDAVAMNWLRTAFDEIARTNADKLPVPELLAFASDPKSSGKARRVALVAVERVQRGTTEKLLRTWLNDPEFGVDAVELAIRDAEKLPDAELAASLKKVFAACTDPDLSQTIAKRLTGLGVTVDLWSHLGVVKAWHIVGPFPATPEAGLEKSFPPETKIDFAAEYDGKASKLRWQPVMAEEGKVDLVKTGVKTEDGSVVYAVARFNLPNQTTGELRLSAVDNITAWVNGQKVIERKNDYRSMYRTDRYRTTVTLPQGESTLLLKLTKTRPDESQQAGAGKTGRPGGGAAARWDFQARILNANAQGVVFTQSEGKK